MLDIIPDASERWRREPEAIRAQHTLEVLGHKITLGKEILTRVLNDTPRGFRSGCLATCDEMYQALAVHGYRWSSNRVVNPMGWRYINGHYDANEPWQADVPPHPYSHKVALPPEVALPSEAGLIEVPMVSEYTWLLQPEDIDRHLDLAKRDFDRARQESGVFVALSHYYAMTGEYSAGLEVYKRLFAHARERGDVRFCTINQLVELRGLG